MCVTTSRTIGMTFGTTMVATTEGINTAGMTVITDDCRRKV